MRSIELFSGAGGLALGLEQAGFETVALFERNAEACKTLRLNRPNWQVVEADVREVDFKEHGPIDLIAGGPPCQPFSVGGKAKGSRDSRDMFPEAVRAVRELQPYAFIFENVRGLLRSSFANYVEFIRLQLSYPIFPISQNVSWETNLQRLQRHHTSRNKPVECSYKVTINLADAANYGVPQRRHRVFFVGIRNDLDVGWHFPRITHTQDDLLALKFVSGGYWANHRIPAAKPPTKLLPKIEKLRIGQLLEVTQPWLTVRDAIKDLPSPSKSAGTPEIPNHRFQPGARSYPGHTGSPLDEPAKALKAGDHGVPGGENMLRHPNGKVRYFSVRESARLQTFPDDYHFQGSWTECMRQLGNAVPVRLARIVAESLAVKIRPFTKPDSNFKRESPPIS